MKNLTRVARLGVLAFLATAPPALAGIEVTVRGVEGAERTNVEKRLSILAYAGEDGDDEAEVRRLHRRAEADIRSALEAYGYYSPKVRSKLSGAGREWKATYVVEAGEPTRLGTIALSLSGEGSEFPELVSAIENSGLHQGARLQHAVYEGTKNALARAAFDHGFLDARFTKHTLRVDPQQHRADVELQLDTGPRYRFGEVDVAQEGLDPEFIRRYVPIVPGEWFEPAKLLQSQFALSDLGYFSTVEVQPHRELAVDRRVPITIATTPRPRHRYDVGLGYGTDTGARLTLGTELRRLNQRGHRVRGDLRVSEIKNSIGTDYRIPLGTRAGENLGFAAAYTDEKINEGFSRTYDVGTTLSRTPGDWQRQVYLKYRFEQSLAPDTGLDTTKLLLPGLTLSRGEMDDAIHARLGWSVFFDVHGGNQYVMSDVSFAQSRVLVRGVLPVGENARFLMRTEFGASVLGEDFSDLPPSQRFYAGGDQSVRGYSYQSLGPTDADGKVIGGQYLSTYSAELEYRIHGNWGAAVFADAGGADNDTNPALSVGIGAGVRYRAPVGTLQFDLAHPLDGDERGIRPHLGIRVGL
jgi:translocation and assembly module TamA